MVLATIVLMTVSLSALLGTQRQTLAGLFGAGLLGFSTAWALDLYWFPAVLQCLACVLAWLVVHRHFLANQHRMIREKKLAEAKAEARKKRANVQTW